jgi:hypothetical protein
MASESAESNLTSKGKVCNYINGVFGILLNDLAFRLAYKNGMSKLCMNLSVSVRNIPVFDNLKLEPAFIRKQLIKTLNMLGRDLASVSNGKITIKASSVNTLRGKHILRKGVKSAFKDSYVFNICNHIHIECDNVVYDGVSNIFIDFSKYKS